MLKIFQCRRSSLALIGISCLTAMCLIKGIDVSMAISTIVMGVAAANSYEKSKIQ